MNVWGLYADIVPYIIFDLYDWGESWFSLADVSRLTQTSVICKAPEQGLACSPKPTTRSVMTRDYEV